MKQAARHILLLIKEGREIDGIGDTSDLYDLCYNILMADQSSVEAFIDMMQKLDYEDDYI